MRSADMMNYDDMRGMLRDNFLFLNMSGKNIQVAQVRLVSVAQLGQVFVCQKA